MSESGSVRDVRTWLGKMSRTLRLADFLDQNKRPSQAQGMRRVAQEYLNEARRVAIQLGTTLRQLRRLSSADRVSLTTGQPLPVKTKKRVGPVALPRIIQIPVRDEACDRRLAQIEQEYDGCRADLESAAKRLTDCEQRILQAQDQMDEQERQDVQEAKELKTEVDRLRRQHNSASANEEELKDCQRTLNQVVLAWSNRLNEQSRKNQELQWQLEELQVERDRVTEQLQDSEGRERAAADVLQTAVAEFIAEPVEQRRYLRELANRYLNT